jgi:hypothetical protein
MAPVHSFPAFFSPDKATRALVGDAIVHFHRLAWVGRVKVEDTNPASFAAALPEMVLVVRVDLILFPQRLGQRIVIFG